MRRSARQERTARAKRKARRPRITPQDVDAELFFEKLLPEAIKKNRYAFEAQSGSICVWVYNVGTWTIRLGEKDLSMAVTKESCFSADLVAAFNEKTFARFLAGEPIEPENGCFFEGDAKLLSRLGRVLQMPRGTVALRAVNM
jgi:hypothetical protein